MGSARDGLALGVLMAGVWLVLCMQVAVTPSRYAWDQAAGRVVRVWEPGHRPVLVVLADCLDRARCDFAAVLGW